MNGDDWLTWRVVFCLSFIGAAIAYLLGHVVVFLVT